jgi:tetratricopeptide (TPR) repeat protein
MIRMKIMLSAAVVCALASVACSLTADSAKRKAFDRGTRLYEKGRYAEASIEFRKAIQKDPKFGEAYWKLGQAELKQGRPDAAASALNQAAILLPDRVEPKVELAELYLNGYMADPRKPAGPYQSASRYINEILHKDPNSFDGLRLKGLQAVADNKPKEAIENFRRADQIHPDRPDVATLLVQNLFQDGQSDAAQTLASRFLEKHKDYGPMYDILYSNFMQRNRQENGESVLKLKVANNPKNSFYLTQLARHYWNTGKRDQSDGLLDRLKARPGDFTNAYEDAGNFYAEIGDFESARQQYEAGERVHEKDKLSYQKRLATVLIAVGQRVEAEKLLDKILKEHPDETTARASRGALQAAKGKPEDLDRAIADFKYLAGAQPGNPEFLYQLARAYELKGAEEAAKAQYLAILRSNSGYVPALDAVSHLYLREQRFADANRYAEMWLSIDPANPSPRLVHSASLAAFGDYDQTRSVLAALIRDYPKLEEAQIQLALLEVMQKRFDEAEQIFRKYYQPGRGDFRSLRGMAETYRARGQKDRAIAMIEEELGRYPQSVEGIQLLAETAALAGKYDLAIEQYQHLQRLRPESSHVHIELGLLYDVKGEHELALSHFQTARQMNSKDPLAPALMGRVREQIGRKREAIQDYRESLHLDPDNASVMNNLAYALAETNGDPEEALRVARRALEKDPNNLDFTDTLGWIYLKKNELPSALQIFRGLRQKQPQNATFRIHLAMALFASGDTGSAHRELVTAQELHPSSSELAQIKELLAQM